MSLAMWIVFLRTVRKLRARSFPEYGIMPAGLLGRSCRSPWLRSTRDAHHISLATASPVAAGADTRAPNAASRWAHPGHRPLRGRCAVLAGDATCGAGHRRADARLFEGKLALDGHLLRPHRPDDVGVAR